MRTEACPKGESIAALAGGTLPAPESARVADHAADCPSCFRALAAARAVLATPIPPGDFDLTEEDVRSLREQAAPGLPGSAGGRSTGERAPAKRSLAAWVPYAAAAGVALLVVGGGLRILDRAPSVPAGAAEVRGNGKGIVVVFPRPGTLLEAPPERIEWSAEAQGGEFRVRILASVTEELWRARTSERTIPVPPEARRRLALGGRFLVEVGRMDGAAEPSEVEVVPIEVRAPR